MQNEAGEETDLRRVQGAASRERLLQAASELIAERGVAATGVEAICKRAGVVKSALYWHFGSKQALVAAVVERVGDQWVDEVMASVRQAGGRMERLDRFVAELRHLTEERPELLRVILAGVVETSEVGPETQDAVRTMFFKIEEAITEGLHDAVGGVLPHPERVSFLVIALVVAIALRARLVPDGTDLGDLFGVLRRVLAREILHQIRVAGL